MFYLKEYYSNFKTNNLRKFKKLKTHILHKNNIFGKANFKKYITIQGVEFFEISKNFKYKRSIVR